MTQRRKRGRLFYKFLFVFLIVSLVPLGIVGYYLVNLTQVTLNKAITRDQESLAVVVADLGEVEPQGRFARQGAGGVATEHIHLAGL
jgi:hypothetical protein